MCGTEVWFLKRFGLQEFEDFDYFDRKWGMFVHSGQELFFFNKLLFYH